MALFFVPLQGLFLRNPEGVIDHIDRNPLNSRKYNLRVVTPVENARNIVLGAITDMV